MIDKEQDKKELFDYADQVVAAAKKAGADVAESVARRGSHLSASVRKGETELLEEAGSRSLGLRVMLGQQVAVTYTNDFTANGLQTLVRDAVELAKLSQPDSFAGAPEASLLSKESEHQDLNLFDPEMDSMSADQAIERAITGEAAALAFDTRISNSKGASMSRASGSVVVVTSGGFRGYNLGTYASLSVQPVAEEQENKKKHTGYYWTSKRHLHELKDAKEVGEEAARRTLRRLGAKKVETQELPVVFDPDTAKSILALFAGCIMGSGIWRKTSYLAGRLDSEVASPLINIVDDPLIPKGPGSRSFDGEGLLSRKNIVVENGMLKTYLMDSYAARKLNMQSTASASRGSSAGVGASTTNFILSPGSMTREELIKDTKKGLYITDMMGFGFSGVTGDFSRGASGFWIENGELTYPVSEITISLNLDKILKRIDAVADDVDMRGSVAAPTFRVSAMTVAGK